MDQRSSFTPRDLECMLYDETADPKALPLSLLEEITDDFSDDQRIGSGGFAVVYKGMLEHRTVAVKRMSNVYMDEKVFHREIECLMMVKHKNVVRFLGYCADRQGSMQKYNGKFVMADVNQRLLCFEYLPKGSLDNYITDMSCGLRWRDRYQIITGICQGLHYLHQKNIVHLDLKPANILLDDNLLPKITDFGISRCFSEIQSRDITMIAGTFGYLAPESFNNTKVTYRHSYRLDIYSLGVVITEILTGERGYHDVDNVVESWSNMLEKSQSDVQMKQVRVCAEIGVECIDSNPTKRPDTEHIISRLNECNDIDAITSQQAEHTTNELHQDTPNTLGEASSSESATAATAVETNPYSPFWKNTANYDMSNATMEALWLSYQQLNPDIRQCIEYCSIFPKGSKLRRFQLVHLWIAQGFVKTSCATEDMEDVAEGYIKELVSCSFLQPGKHMDGEGCFTIHDVLHDLLDKIAGNCFRIKNARSKRGKGWKGRVPRDVEHLLIAKYDAELITEKILEFENLLTLIVYVVEDDTPIEERVIDSICKRLPKLRVLAVAFSKKHYAIRQFEKFSIPESISQLKHLCYFAFRTQSLCMIILPSSLSKSQHIQFLDFGDCHDFEFTFADLSNLRRLICGSQVLLPNLGKMISLRTIPWAFRVRKTISLQTVRGDFMARYESEYEVKELRDLNKLRGRLEIMGLENVKSKEEAIEANLASKERLRVLVLKWDSDDRSLAVEAEVLEGLCPPVGLESLCISGYGGSRYPDWMGSMQNGGPKDLRQLEFHSCTQLGGPAPQLAEAFPHLRVLSLCFCSWNALPSDVEYLTSLKRLVIDRCSNIRSLPTLPVSLEKLTLSSCSDELMGSCKTVGHPNWQKIQHIPNKYIHTNQ